MHPGQTPLTPAAAKSAALGSLWTFPAVLCSAFIIGWAAEAAQFVLSRGLALAILAWLQTLPEFAVEAAIAWRGDVDMMTANFTGSLRLLVGLGWPMIYFTMAFFRKGRLAPGESRWRPIELPSQDAVGIFFLLPPMLYFLVIVIKASLCLYDAVILFVFYAAYLAVLFKLPPQETEDIDDMESVPRYIVTRSPWLRNLLIIALFLGGGIVLYLTVDPFIESMLGLAVLAGVTPFVFVQWVAPFLSEFPEKLTAFNWARRVSHAPMAVMNMVSSNVNQWTVLAGMIPLVYSISRGRVMFVPLDHPHQIEIGLTLLQSLLGFLFLLELRFQWWEAAGLFFLWFVQFIQPHLREEMLFVYSAWILVEILLYATRRKPVLLFSALRSIPFKTRAAKT